MVQQFKRARARGQRLGCFVVALVLAVLACARADVPIDYGNITPIGATTPVWLQGSPGAPVVVLPATVPPATVPVPGLPSPTPWPTQDISFTPTPDPVRPSILDRQSVLEYVVDEGDSLSQIGERYGVSASEIAAANDLDVSDTLFVGQVLRIPIPNPNDFGSDLKLVPDSELVFSPGTIGFNVNGLVNAYDGYLARYTEEIPGRYLDGSAESRVLSGAEIVQLVAERYSVNPRLLLALLEYQAGWLTESAPGSNTLAFPIGRVEPGREGLYRQLAWAANQLNEGYYLWRAGGLISWSFGDGSIRLVSPGLNAGTVGVQHFFAQLLIPTEWERAVSLEGFLSTYWALFGNPFRYAYEPLVPPFLVQPEFQLPFEPGDVWAFTGGPHGAWDTGSGWGALDFAPPGEPRGCVSSDAWVVASAPGVIVRAGDGAVIQDLDGDGYEQTGWVLFYMHIDRHERVEVGRELAAGDRIGHPSCEGGISSGTHVHMARKYNGEWVAADGPIPFVLDGWVSAGLGREYDGTMSNGTESIEACNCRADFNAVARP